MLGHMERLFSLLTGIKPEIRYGALKKITDPETQFTRGEWRSSSAGDCPDGCIMIIAAAGARRLYPNQVPASYDGCSKLLGMSFEDCAVCIAIWDGAFPFKTTARDRRRLIEKLRNYIAEAYPAQVFEAEPPNPEPVVFAEDYLYGQVPISIF
jgi:hypothetical protein